MRLRHYTTSLFTLAAFIFGVSAADLVLAQDADAIPVKVVEVKKESIRPSFSHPARIESFQTASVRPIIAAQILKIHVRPGQLVKKGDLLIELDKTDYEIAVAQAKANLLKAKASEVQAIGDFERARQLVGRGSVSQRDLDIATATRDVASAEVQVNEALLQKAEKALADTEVVAPFDGRASKPNYGEGDLFQPGDPTQPGSVLEIESLDPIYAVGRVDQANYFDFLIRRLKLEEQSQSIPTLELTLILPGGTEYPHTGVFEDWDNTAVASSGTIAARIVFPNPDGYLLPGENVTINGAVIEAIETLTVPQRAVSLDQQGHFVYVVSDGVVKRQNIEVGIRDGANWSVPEGLNENDVVVVEGLQKIRVGRTVTTENFDG
ncbi:efflux RND transporter periplasmic adaptor subunit [Falsihalocynthiibacter sp. SS001]|uniref:efflux RND transporter periplasmic adaptor subunit n=1 Tax=Falsihalocynthiibacter sp. SS001 TaxID=3349698 RepID=UPI0036D3CAC7